ncbi:putative 5-3 exonuclease [Macleaya cordata]|uniref:5'-3' exoribonuclease n=1 Tax=Macleaya cordata TaxID=56857 RepID=A0A200Q9I0_MACCD|nr:putative 5-3 exonuclease [Macleaya cordata]
MGVPSFYRWLLFPPTTFDEVFKSIFQYIDRLFQIVRPRKLLYLAIDGVAPRAKMNQQRSRRFRTAKDTELAEEEEERLRKEFEMEGKNVLPKLKSETSDSNIITPGTEFMDKLSKALQYYIRLRLNSDPGWKKIKVILSDANVPGEGEHKIMKFIRLQRNLPGYDPNTVHCLYGLDADLIMLALATHEPHFSLLREDVLAQVQQPSCSLPLQSSLSKTEFNSVKSRGWFNRVHEQNGGVSITKKTYQFLNIWTLREYLELDLQISDPPCAIDLERLIDDFIFMCFLIGNDFLPHMPSLQINEGSIDLLMAVYKHEFNSLGGYLIDAEKLEDKKASYVKLKRIEKFILAVGSYEERIFKKRLDLQERKLKSLMRQKAYDVDDKATEDFPFNQALESLQLDNRRKDVSMAPDESSQTFNTSTLSKEDAVLENTKELKRKVKDFMREQSDLFKQGGFEKDKIRLGMQGWKERYYKEKFSVENPKEIESIRTVVVQKYIEGLCWVLQYYFSGVPSWTWYYPFHYGPFASDLKGLGKINIKFKMGAPFKPFDQLMGVLPPRSVSALPKAYWNLMTSEESNLIDFYPTEFEVDADGKHYLWQGTVKLPFIKEEQLLFETKKVENELKEHEARKNTERMDVMFMNGSHDLGSQILSNKSAGRVSIDVHASGGMNGYILPCNEDLSTSFSNVNEMEDVSKDDVIYVLYELPDTHTHIPRLAEKVELPEKTITEEDIVKTPLWHEFEGWAPPTNRLHIQQKYRQVKTVASPESAKEIWKVAGSGFSAGRGKGNQTTSDPSLNIQSTAGFHGAKSGTFIPSGSSSGKAYAEQVSPNHSIHSYRRIQAVTASKFSSTGTSSVGQRWTGDASNQAIWRGNRSSGISNSGQGYGSNGRRPVGNSSFWPSRNVSSTNGNSSTPQYVWQPAGRGRGRGSFETLTTDTDRSRPW